MTARTTMTALLTATLTLAACAGGTPPPKGGDPTDVQATAPGKATCPATSQAQNRAGAEATNGIRGRSDLPPVRANMLLAEVAAQHACDMAKRGRMTHVGSTTTGPGPRVKARGYAPMLTAENIAAGPFDLPRVLGEWNNSQGHLRNILIPQVRDYGIGQAIAADGKTRFWAAVYAAPRN
ncbi:MAG: CAP domain-containing protein [Paracoccus sp. (in: a-proteobacteria)]|jgi:uncharacterized protein YkwD|uniref:CAP domain-containing protein n=2 Tax=Paracoccus TaxID=265 RepID=UPI00260F3831|nr:CAP domain-containing protein [uncultured Paracoccus sp.]